MHLELIISLLGSAGVIIWQAAWHSSRLKRLEEQNKDQADQIQALRNWKHDRVNPLLQEFLWDKDQRREFEVEDTRNHQLPSVKK